MNNHNNNNINNNLTENISNSQLSKSDIETMDEVHDFFNDYFTSGVSPKPQLPNQLNSDPNNKINKINRKDYQENQLNHENKINQKINSNPEIKTNHSKIDNAKPLIKISKISLDEIVTFQNLLLKWIARFNLNIADFKISSINKNTGQVSSIKRFNIIIDFYEL